MNMANNNAKDVEALRLAQWKSTMIDIDINDNDDTIKNPEYRNRNVGTLQRRLKSRHVQFRALSGAIGNGLFVGTG